MPSALDLYKNLAAETSPSKIKKLLAAGGVKVKELGAKGLAVAKKQGSAAYQDVRTAAGRPGTSRVAKQGGKPLPALKTERKAAGLRTAGRAAVGVAGVGGTAAVAKKRKTKKKA